MKGLIEIDGRTGEGGGQVVRVAVALSALTGQALKITNVRGNRKGGGSPTHFLLSKAGFLVLNLSC